MVLFDGDKSAYGRARLDILKEIETDSWLRNCDKEEFVYICSVFRGKLYEIPLSKWWIENCEKYNITVLSYLVSKCIEQIVNDIIKDLIKEE